MPRILTTSAEAAEYLWKNPGKEITDAFGCLVKLTPKLLVLHKCDGVSWQPDGAALCKNYAPFRIVDEPGNEELPEEVKAAIAETGHSGDWWVKNYTTVATALWRATQKAIRESGGAK